MPDALKDHVHPTRTRMKSVAIAIDVQAKSCAKVPEANMGHGGDADVHPSSEDGPGQAIDHWNWCGAATLEPK
ncbi:unnamed protein product, partial [Aphanomyces euteiches]